MVLREKTERPEGVESGNVKLVGTNKIRIIQEIVDLLEKKTKYLEMTNARNPYGDGHAASRIISAILKY